MISIYIHDIQNTTKGSLLIQTARTLISVFGLQTDMISLCQSYTEGHMPLSLANKEDVTIIIFFFSISFCIDEK